QAGFNRMVTGLEERERLREAFGTFVDPELGERILREGTDLAGEEVEVSVLFLDVRGFTSLAERTGARDVVARLNALYERVVPISEATRDRLQREPCAWQRRPPIPLKGKSEPVALYAPT